MISSTGFVMIMMFIVLKTGISPMHLWLVQAYQSCPKTVLIFFSGASTKVIIYIFLKFVTKITNFEYILQQAVLHNTLVCLFVATLIVGGFFSFFADSDRKMLAYSSISQMGYIFLAILSALGNSLHSALTIIVGHALAKVNLLLILFASKQPSFNGLFRNSPVLAFPMLVSLLSLAGSPLTLGFVGKWLLFYDLYQSQSYLVLACFVVGTCTTALYTWNVIEKAFLIDNDQKVDCHLIIKLSSCFMALLLLVLGLFPQKLLLLFDHI